MLSVYSMFSTVLKSQCPKCFRFRTYVTRKRFYRCTGIIQNENKWEVTLDQRRLKTPNGRILMVNSEPLAHAIAAEWDAQKDTIGQPTMHLTALCNTALDNPGKLTTHGIASYLLDYFPTDTLLFHSEEEELRSLQEKKWTPVIDWFQKKFGVTQEISKGLEPSPVTTETRAVLARYFLSYDFAALNAICFGVEALKSPLLMLACIERHLEPREAVLLARLEEEFQLMRWGRVPWAHELNQAELSSRVAAALLVIQCSTEKHTTTVKTPVNEQAVN
ncbi:ATP synthase mitochondrial F1 complex assembly factor 2 isoform X1 [Achroia grisella]|uniref:ATP synthase mitochondrial F1 complex assembly factor 2 isoform X1 n=1 Tax=Achroia grisella TaxID=688607 RepID=UPI0027D20C4C|nr:ATP synthase mitochondrial F1 complex assembly factor 2 isoform X1 [Achroia grisella]